ncbi:hypothetical protein OOY67_000671 [Vibrio parahaemolyticus]|nr:hypothetical protein [Vibrio parahaemolyticus]
MNRMEKFIHDIDVGIISIDSDELELDKPKPKVIPNPKTKLKPSNIPRDKMYFDTQLPTVYLLNGISAMSGWYKIGCSISPVERSFNISESIKSHGIFGDMVLVDEIVCESKEQAIRLEKALINHLGGKCFHAKVDGFSEIKPHKPYVDVVFNKAKERIRNKRIKEDRKGRRKEEKNPRRKEGQHEFW